MKKLMIVVCVALFVSCNSNVNEENKKVEQQTIAANNPLRPIDELVSDVVSNGSIKAYRKLKIWMISPREGELLPYALIMANKYNYIPAYYDVYDCLWAIYKSSKDDILLLDNLDDTTKKLSLEYLQKGAGKGDPNCQWYLGNYYLEGIYVERDTILGKMLIEQSDRKRSKSF